MSGIHKIVLTGGPSGGKSTLQQAVSEQIPGAYCVPEVATILLGGGFPAPTERHPWDGPWQRNFQQAVAAGQLALEEVCLRRAAGEDKQLILFDRGIIDGAAYLPGSVSELEDMASHSEQAMLSRYDTVLHLTTSAAHDVYDKHSNPHRFEETEEALRLDDRIMTAWGNHPNRIVLGEPTKSERVVRGLSIVQAILGLDK